MVVLAAAVVATAGLLVFLIATQDDRGDPALGPIATTATELRSRANAINQMWDDQEGTLPDDDRRQLYEETERQLEELAADTRGLAPSLLDLPVAISAADRTALEAGVADMVRAADQMLEGLRVPGRNNKELRLSGLDLYQSGAESVLDVTGPAPG